MVERWGWAYWSMESARDVLLSCHVFVVAATRYNTMSKGRLLRYGNSHQVTAPPKGM